MVWTNLYIDEAMVHKWRRFGNRLLLSLSASLINVETDLKQEKVKKSFSIPKYLFVKKIWVSLIILSIYVIQFFKF